MSRPLTEDDIYRTSSQYRLWSFSPEQLAAQRKKTHELAVERARRYGGHQSNGVANGATNGTANGASPDFLTEEECLRLVQRYSEQLRTTSDHFKFTVSVKTTAVQYLRRFYLSNSPLTYPPKEIYKTVLFLACKAEATHTTLSEYARRISTDPGVVLAPEYKVMQALRFTLDVRQPWRGLKGALMELLNMAEGKLGVIQGVDIGSGQEIQKMMMELPYPTQGNKTPWSPPKSGSVELKHIHDRVQAAYSAARSILDAPALLTDVYFLYTPSQIMLAALQLADEPLTSLYLSTKLSTSSPTRPKILATLSSCVEMLASFDQSQVLTKDERAALESKLEACRDPATRDLVKAFAMMRQGGEDDEKAQEKAKRRKTEREKNEKEGNDLFGPGLGAKG
jgi:cyclin H